MCTVPALVEASSLSNPERHTFAVTCDTTVTVPADNPLIASPSRPHTCIQQFVIAAQQSTHGTPFGISLTSRQHCTLPVPTTRHRLRQQAPAHSRRASDCDTARPHTCIQQFVIAAQQSTHGTPFDISLTSHQALHTPCAYNTSPPSSAGTSAHPPCFRLWHSAYPAFVTMRLHFPQRVARKPSHSPHLSACGSQSPLWHASQQPRESTPSNVCLG
jgi:hypothetical protein